MHTQFTLEQVKPVSAEKYYYLALLQVFGNLLNNLWKNMGIC